MSLLISSLSSIPLMDRHSTGTVPSISSETFRLIISGLIRNDNKLSSFIPRGKFIYDRNGFIKQYWTIVQGPILLLIVYLRFFFSSILLKYSTDCGRNGAIPLYSAIGPGISCSTLYVRSNHSWRNVKSSSGRN